MPRRLDPDEAALWARVTATVRPMERRKPRAQTLITPQAPVAPLSPRPVARPASSGQAPAKSPRKIAAPANTLDGSWDRRLASGRISPDMTIDLHGHTLASAHAMLERSLGEAVARGCRVMLVITGNPPKARMQGDRPRGLIREQLPSWLAASAHSHDIAAVRGAHIRHGGRGALYLILRRRRETAG